MRWAYSGGGGGTRSGIEPSARTVSRGPLLTVDVHRAVEVGASKHLPPRDRPCRICTFCAVSEEAGVGIHELRVKADGRSWSVAGMWLVQVGAAEHGTNGRRLESSNGDDAIRADVERGEDDERRHARPGPRRVRGGGHN